jgi:hypothetical protein
MEPLRCDYPPLRLLALKEEEIKEVKGIFKDLSR